MDPISTFCDGISTAENLPEPLAFTLLEIIGFSGRVIFQKERAEERRPSRIGNETRSRQLETDGAWKLLQ